jgi:hypothetical protein
MGVCRKLGLETVGDDEYYNNSNIVFLLIAITRYVFQQLTIVE